MVERTNKQTGQKFYGCAKFGRGGCNETEQFKPEERDTSFIESIDLD